MMNTLPYSGDRSLPHSGDSTEQAFFLVWAEGLSGHHFSPQSSGWEEQSQPGNEAGCVCSHSFLIIGHPFQEQVGSDEVIGRGESRAQGTGKVLIASLPLKHPSLLREVKRQPQDS